MADTEPSTQDATGPDPTPHRSPFDALAHHVRKAGLGHRAALARLQPDDLQPHELAALARALLAAGLDPQRWHVDTWPRWALIAHGMALAGHDGRGMLGRQLADARVSESRVSRLLTARGEAFRQLLPRVLRLMASHGVAPNWRELGELVLSESSHDRAAQDRAEALRLRLAGDYFTAKARAASA